MAALEKAKKNQIKYITKLMNAGLLAEREH
jgi:hypothetical protein